MILRNAALLFFLLFYVCTNAKAGKISSDCVQINADSYFDGIKFHDQSVSLTVRKGVIAKIESRTKKVRKACNTVYEAPFIMPALIEPHSHIFLKTQNQFYDFPKVSALSEKLSQEARIAEAHQNAASYFRSGFWYLRDLGNNGPDELITNWVQQRGEPEITFSGQGIAFRNSQLSIQSKEYRLINSKEEFLKDPPKIRKNQKWLKIYLDNDPAEGFMPTEIAETIISWAHRNKLKVAAHAELNNSLIDAKKILADTFEHVGSVTQIPDSKNLILTPINTAVCEDIRKKELSFERCSDLKNKNAVLLKKILKSQSRFGVGSDSYFDFDLNRGHSALQALTSLKESGLDNIEILKLVTRDNAKMMGLKKDGKIQNAFNANLIGLSANPIQSLKNLGSLQWVYSQNSFYCVNGKCF